jgi:electron transport complex protein RnfA
MSSLLVILIGTVLVNTFLLMQDDEALGGSRQRGSITSAIRIAGATSVVLIVAAVAANLLWRFFKPLPSDALLFVYAMTVATIAVLLDRLTRNRLPRLGRALASAPLLAVSNSLALGTGLLTPMSNDITSTILGALVLALAFVIALALFVALVSRITEREVPTAFQVTPITFVSAGLFTLALMGFTGLLRG